MEKSSRDRDVPAGPRFTFLVDVDVQMKSHNMDRPTGPWDGLRVNRSRAKLCCLFVCHEDHASR